MLNYFDHKPQAFIVIHRYRLPVTRQINVVRMLIMLQACTKRCHRNALWLNLQNWPSEQLPSRVLSVFECYPCAHVCPDLLVDVIMSIMLKTLVPTAPRLLTLTDCSCAMCCVTDYAMINMCCETVFPHLCFTTVHRPAFSAY